MTQEGRLDDITHNIWHEIRRKKLKSTSVKLRKRYAAIAKSPWL